MEHYTDEDKCTCNEEFYDEELCPFALEIAEEEKLCVCCPACRRQCLMDI